MVALRINNECDACSWKRSLGPNGYKAPKRDTVDAKAVVAFDGLVMKETVLLPAVLLCAQSVALPKRKIGAVVCLNVSCITQIMRAIIEGRC